MIVEEVLSHYDMGDAESVTAGSGGTANQNYRVHTSTGDYFIKCRLPRLSSIEHVRLQHGVLLHLAAGNLPVQAPLHVRDTDETFLRDGDRLWEVTPFTVGHKFRGSKREIESAGLTLGRLHRCLESFQPTDFAANGPLHENRKQIEQSLQLAEPLFAEPELAGVRVAFHRAFDLLNREFYGSIELELQRSIIHGDYHALNLVFDPAGHVAGVFDWDATGVQIRLRDVVDGLIAFGRKEPEKSGGGNIIELTRPFDFDPGGVHCFLSAYHRVKTLSDLELRALPLMLRQRWLGIKLDPLRLGKVDRVAAVELMRDAQRPLQWLDETDALGVASLQSLLRG
ncbi:MAG: hypothetical protein AUJ92_07465 [Armatimonadetes bacterium CG2_30_59_28]|nr:phosphotransferase [Armatimonadota bacterium]OIO95768.1 MAG: hypothetical protein AUJ92_07465 [Armatimonadetes bacterium CG2_30_59_28]PIU67057.1 MAG: hypothetical protein COS85_02185 [Armatimonadetes bacterium CG07_land_8_20_14_0_80_59_28]PIY41386.1 MAG: hypothetical protein COZ05_15785 [Armatimonadetes bacterium CG_4_10_14_3_um_filter_59_10]